jgi:hypothetical protein
MHNWKSPLIQIGLILICLFTVGGCSDSSGEAKSDPQPSQEPKSPRPVFAVIGADISGSYEHMTRKAISICVNLIGNANPGDTYASLLPWRNGGETVPENIPTSLDEIVDKTTGAVDATALDRKIFELSRMVGV